MKISYSGLDRQDLTLVSQQKIEMGASSAAVTGEKNRASHVLSGIIAQAIQDGASDIHLEPGQERMRIRERVYGVLQEMMLVPREMGESLTLVVKLWADLDLEERRKPQKGRISVRASRGQDCELIVQVAPGLNGERAVLRIMSFGQAPTRRQMGLDTNSMLTEMVNRPYGLVLFVGRAGSGKTTVLYGVLQSLDPRQRNIAIIDEEPPYQVKGVNRSLPGIPLQTALRALCQHNIDVIATSELSGPEEVELALQAAATGRLVLGVFHAEDVAQAIERVGFSGVSPYQFGSGLSGIIASRLVRKICTNCKQTDQPAVSHLEALGIPVEMRERSAFYRGAGCEKCRQTGFEGRVGLFETVSVDLALSRLIIRRAAGAELREHLKSTGFCSFRDSAISKALDGTTTVEEALRVVGPEISDQSSVNSDQ